MYIDSCYRRNITIYIYRFLLQAEHITLIFMNKGEDRLREALTDPVGPAEQTGPLMGSAEQTAPTPVSPRGALIQPSFTNGQFLRNYVFKSLNVVKVYIHLHLFRCEAARSS